MNNKEDLEKGGIVIQCPLYGIEYPECIIPLCQLPKEELKEALNEALSKNINNKKE